MRKLSRGNEMQQLQAVVYARVSSKEQERDGFSIPAQLKLLHTYAEQRGLKITAEFVDVETAKKAGRTGFGEMLAFLKNPRNHCSVVLVEKTDRLYRNIRDWVTLDDMALEIHFVKENTVLSGESRSNEKFMHGIKVLMAKNYIDNLSEETRKGMLEKAEEGIWPSYAPLGYQNTTDSNGKHVIEPDPALASKVTRLYEAYATAQHSLKDLSALARDLELSFRGSGHPLPVSTVHKILTNRIYTGDFVWHGKTYHGIHTPLVSHELWDHVQDVLAGRNRQCKLRSKHDFAFSGLIRCGHCGCLLVGETKKQRYTYYHCSHFKGKCPEPYVREEVLLDRFVDMLSTLVFPANTFGWLKQALH